MGHGLKTYEMNRGYRCVVWLLWSGWIDSYLSIIEKGQANATITSYVKIAIGLGVDLKDLFDI